GLTRLLGDSKRPSGRAGRPLEPAPLIGIGLPMRWPEEPMAQLIAPGGPWMESVLAVEFHTTPQPMVHPWPEPMVPRLMKLMAPPCTLTLSTRKPVPQRWCGSMDWSPLKLE